MKDKNINDVFIESSLLYLNEDPDKNTENNDDIITGNPVSNEIKESAKHKGVIGKIGGIGADSNKPTRNNRRYTLKLWQNVEKSEYFIEGMENRTIIGEANHPNERLDYSIIDGAVILTKFEIQEDGTVYTEFDILDTLPGRTVKAYFDAGCKLGVSSRGLGEEVVVNGETIIDPETYQFYCFDVVAFPAVKTARMELIESTSPKRESFIKSIMKEINNCKSINELKFIESTAVDANLYLDEIKEAIDIKKTTFEDKVNNKHELPNPEEVTLTPISSFDDPKEAVDSYKEIINVIDELKSNATETDLWFKNVIQLQLDKYASENNLSKTSENNNKIKISDSKLNSDEDTTDEDEESNLQLLAEIQEKLKLNRQLEQKNIVIRNLIANNYSKDKSLQENINTYEQLISIKEQYNSLLKENNTLNLKNKYLQSKLSNELAQLTSKYEKLQSVNKEFSSIIFNLREQLNKNNKVNKSLNESIKRLTSNNSSLQTKNKELTLSNTKLENKINKNNSLNENVDIIKSENSNLKIENKSLNNIKTKQEEKIHSLIDERNTLNKKYIESLDKYISTICTKYDLNESTLRRLLGENYGIKEIDKIAKELVENNSKMQSLPFAHLVPDRHIVAENIGLQNLNNDIDSDMDNFHFMLESKYN